MTRALFLILLLCPTALAAQTLTGDWVHSGAAGIVRLSLQQQGAVLRGEMVGADGTRFTLEGALEEGRATGHLEVGGGRGWFALGLVGERIKMVVAEIDATTGRPDLSSGWELDFARTGADRQGGVSGGSESRGAAGAASTADGVPPQSEASPLVREWLTHLRGKRLSYRESYNSSDARGFGGYSDRWDAYLCSDGTFFFQQRSRTNIDTGGALASARSDGTSRGVWRIAEANGVVYLQYRMEGQEGEQGVLRYENGSTFLDRSRVYVTPENPHCR
jgi:hypothetical protein